jgi:hypothetical protein
MIIKVLVIFIIKRQKNRRFFMKRRCNRTMMRRLKQKHKLSLTEFKLKKRRNGG